MLGKLSRILSWILSSVPGKMSRAAPVGLVAFDRSQISIAAVRLFRLCVFAIIKKGNHYLRTYRTATGSWERWRSHMLPVEHLVKKIVFANVCIDRWTDWLWAKFSINFYTLNCFHRAPLSWTAIDLVFMPTVPCAYHERKLRKGFTKRLLANSFS